MPRVDRADSPTVQANDARDLTRSGRVHLAAVEEARAPDGRCWLYDVNVDGSYVGGVAYRDGRWVAVRQGWRDTPRSKRHAAVRRLLMSHPAGSFDRRQPGRDTDD